MEFQFCSPDLRRVDEMSAELIACGVFEDERPLGGLAGLLDFRLAGRLSRLARAGFLRGERGELFLVPPRPRLPFDKLLLVGLGARSAFGDGTFRSALAQLSAAIEHLAVRRAVVELPGRSAAMIEPERAAELLLEAVGSSTAHDAWWLVEAADAQKRIAARTQDERRRVRVVR
jgi:hypothetical protein